MSFVGDNITAKLDEKGRMIVPSAFKRRMLSEEMRSFVLKKDNVNECLLLYPKGVWDEQENYLNQRLNNFDPRHRRFRDEFYRNTCEVEMDGSGRLNLPKKLLDLVGIEKDVLVKGGGATLEFWKPDTYEGTALSPEEFAQLGQDIFGNDPIL